MNVQAQMSGQIPAQVPNHAGNQLPGLPQQNGNTFHTQMQNPAAQSNSSVEGSEVIKIRRFMQDKIYETLMKRQSQPTEIISKKIQDMLRRLEEGLFKSATSMEDYMNLNTLESRLHFFAKRTLHSNHAAQPSQFVNTSTPVGAMIPTPGMQHNGNANLTTSAVDPSMISADAGGSMPSATSNMGNLMPNANGSFSNMRGGSFQAAEANSYQRIPSSFSMSSTGNNMTAGQRVTSQMIPTPGFSSSSSQTLPNLDNNNSGGVFSSMDSSMVPQKLPQKHVGGQNSRVLQSLSGAMSSGVRSFMQQTFQNGSLSNGLGNNIHMVNSSGSSDSYLSTSSFGVSSRSSQQPLDQHQRPATQGEGYRLGASGSSGIGSFYNPTAPNGSLVNTQNLNPLRSQSMTRPNSIMSSQSNIQTAQSASYIRPQLVDQAEQVNFQSSQSRENLSQSSVNQYQQQSRQLQRQLQFASYHQERQSNLQQQAFGGTDARISQVASDLRSHVKPEPGMENQSEILQAHLSSGQLHFSELDGQFQHTANGNHFRNSQSLSLPLEPQDMCSTLSQNPQQVMLGEAANEYTSLPNGMQPEVMFHGQWRSEQERASLAGNFSHDKHVQEEFHHRVVVRDGAQCSSFSSEVPVNHQTVASGNTVERHHRVVVHDGAERNSFSSEVPVSHQTVASGNTVDPSRLVATSCSSGNAIRDRQFKDQKRWLLFLRHARWCRAPEGKCPESNCFIAQKLLKHMDGCNASPCSFPRCYPSRRLLHHYRQCRDPDCPVCVPVKDFIRSQVKTYACQDSDSGLPGAVSGTFKSSELEEAKTKETPKPSEIVVEVRKDLQPSMKRFKSEPSSQALMSEGGNRTAPGHANGSNFGYADVHLKVLEKNDHNLQIKSEVPLVKTEIPSGSNPSATMIKSMTTETSCNQGQDVESVLKDFNSSAEEEGVKVEKDNDQMKEEEAPQASEHGAGTKTGKPNIKGVSLTELFTPEQIREHIRSLRKWVGQSKSKVEKNQALEHSMSENSCQLCAVEKLTFEPPPIYCSPCGARIKRNAMYYTVGAGDTRHYFCIPCYNEARGDTILVDGTAISKSRLEKKKNDEETEEWWVQCDKCEAWQHQICALFNGRRNDGGQAEYTCPNCYIQEIERGERKPLPQSAVLGAKDLPRTILSDHIEQRLFRKLKQEREDRARAQGKSYDEVPGAEGIVVRVVSSVDKKLEVKPRFLEIFVEENYPTEFPYKSKVVLLFQKIEGVEVCLFGMYVQEFGLECQPPNQRRVYLSYLDSVKYFRPELKTVTGEALRTFVYHEILIGYLEYCKIRGFTSCYIWACPPLKGEDYILYCHPEIQKTPKSDKLREWYLSMLRKAARENIVVELTNLYDHFFIQTGECNAKVTAARLPYFDGDYWPGAAEDMIDQIYQEEEGRKHNKKGITKKAMTKRALKATGQSDLSSNASKDLLLMHKLGETILPMKEDFIMVHLQYSCTHCCVLMVYGNRWVCKQCKNFHLCDKCYEAEQKREDRDRHPMNQKDKHALYRVEIRDVPDDTKDKDEILESEFFDTRQAFLSLCQGNHYQYDTLRRAKHSSMMVLYHLHNPTAPAFVTTCNMCHLDIETGQGWRCETCPDYDVCNNCYLKDGGIDHPHKLTNHPSLAERDAQNKEARQLRVLQLRKMLDLLVHASQCRSPHCQYPNCRKVKGLFRHGIQCRTRASGGCVLCKKMWYLLQLHARACKEADCHVPRCRDLKEHLRRLQQQSDSRRRAAVMEMMRQRAAEVSGNAS